MAKIHTTNYFNTLIETADDCPVEKGIMPPLKGAKKTIAYLQFEMLYDQPYQYTSDEVLFSVFAQRKAIDEENWATAKIDYFSKGQPCFRTSPLTKKYGWGVHSNTEGKIALLGMESTAYEALVNDDTVRKKKAMRSKRK